MLTNQKAFQIDGDNEQYQKPNASSKKKAMGVWLREVVIPASDLSKQPNPFGHRPMTSFIFVDCHMVALMNIK